MLVVQGCQRVFAGMKTNALAVTLLGLPSVWLAKSIKCS